MSLAVTPGIFAVRMANFINGELWGRVTDESVPWAMRFPTDPEAVRLMGISGGDIANRDRQIQAAIADGKWEAIRDQVPLRHPSQIYEALLEGALLFAILMFVRLRFPKAPHGTLTALFFGCYAIFRIFGEQYREPDSAMVWIFSKGQFYSLFMIGAAISFGWFAWKKRGVELPESPEKPKKSA